MQTLRQDIEYALRQMRLSPVFTLTAMVTLALGIGATTAVFSLIHSIMLKSLPVADPVRAGYNHGTHEGPTFTTQHGGGDVQLSQWFRNASDTYTGGVDVNVARRTTLSYDQFFVLY